MDHPSVHPAVHTFNTSSFTHDSLAPPLRGPVGGEARRPAEPAAGPPGGVRMGGEGGGGSVVVCVGETSKVVFRTILVFKD